MHSAKGWRSCVPGRWSSCSGRASHSRTTGSSTARCSPATSCSSPRSLKLPRPHRYSSNNADRRVILPILRPHQSSGPVRVSGIELLRVMGPGKRRRPALVSLGHDDGGHVSGRQRFARSAVEKAFSTRVSRGRPRAAHSCLGVRAGGRGSVALAGARSPGCAGHGFRANRALTIGNVTIWNSVAFAHV